MTPTRTLLSLLLLTAVAAAQQTGSDPRDVKDPRDVPDPRDAPDPRGQPQTPFEGLEGRELYEALWKAGDMPRLAQAFKQDGWQILPYIDSHCEGWMALLEQSADQTPDGQRRLAEMQAKGRKLAAVADQALGDTRFAVYVDNFYGWDPEQRRQFREGQKLFGQGAQLASEAETPQQMLNALTSLQQSLERSRPLGDTWGQSMALALIGRIQRENVLKPEARATLAEARRLGREIRDLSSVWDALALLYEMAMLELDHDVAKEALQEQYLIALDMGDEKTGAMITRQLVSLDSLMGG